MTRQTQEKKRKKLGGNTSRLTLVLKKMSQLGPSGERVRWGARELVLHRKEGSIFVPTGLE